MKKYVLMISGIFLICCTVCAGLEVRLEPVRKNVTVGRFIQLRLISDKRLTRIDTPVIPGAQWENSYSSSGMQNINGKVSFTRMLMLVPSKEGNIRIPPFKVTAGKESAMTKEVTVRVLPRSASQSQEAKLEDVVKGKLTIAGGKKSFYAGEEMDLFCDLIIDERFISQIRANYFPELLNTKNAVFTTFPYRNGRVRFMISPAEEILEKEQPFIRHRFTARCRVMIPGTFAPEASIRIGVVQQNSMGDDDFFGGGFFGNSFFGSRVTPHTIRFTSPGAVEIKALPALPAGMISTGLVGQWQTEGKLSSNSLRRGEVGELVLTFKGKGAAENFKAPELQFPGFRVYPPEVNKKEQEISAKYALIPLESGEKELRLTLAFFDPSAEKWQGKSLEYKVAVAPGNIAASPGVQKNFTPPAVKDARSSAEQEKNASSPRLLYQKNLPGEWVELPLYRNNILWLLFFAIGMPLAALFFEWRFRRREKELNSPELRKKKQLQKSVNALARELRSQGDTQEFRERLIPLLGESMGLSAGASAGDIAREIKDPELSRYFTALESSSYMPGRTSEGLLSSEAKKALLKLLKKYSLWVLCLFCFTVSGNEGLNEEFNKGEFSKAAAKYLKLSGGSGGYRPAMLYNYGNSRYHLNDLPEARWALTLAQLLAPGDREIRANLELVNARLFANREKTGSFSGALKEMRDHFRCDHYLLWGSFCWGMIWILWSFRRRLDNSLFYGFAGVFFFAGVLCGVSCLAQLRSSYSPRRIIVTAKQIGMRTLPGKSSGSVESTLPGGSEGELLQRDSSGFCRVRINGREGWVTEKSFRRVFPGDLF